MGMYDYIGGEQIKIFYLPVFSHRKRGLNEGSFTWHSGGTLTSYSTQDVLPLKTLYYQYPDNFLVADFNDSVEETMIWVFKDKFFEKIIPLNQLSEEDLVGPVFSYYGEEYTISSLHHFYDYLKDSHDRHVATTKLREAFFPNGYQINAETMNDPVFQQKYQQMNIQLENVQFFFSDVWFKKDTYESEKQLGEALQSLLFAYSLKDNGKIQSYDHMEQYVLCKEYTSDLLANDSSLLERYRTWLGDEELWKDVELALSYLNES